MHGNSVSVTGALVEKVLIAYFVAAGGLLVFADTRRSPEVPKTKPPYPAEFRHRIVELAMAGRTPAELSREFDCSAQTIINWVARAAANRGKPLPGKDVLSTAERGELTRLRRPLRQLQTERDNPEKATAWFAGRADEALTPSSNS